MIKTAGYICAVLAVGTLAMAWSQTQRPQQQFVAHVETISPETITAGHGPLAESKFQDMSFVFTDAN